MGVGVEALFTSALGLVPPWLVADVKLDTAKRRIDFEVGCAGALLTCPQCGVAGQPVHDRLRRSWRHLDFFQFEAWLHAEVPRVACAACGKTTQLPVPWARPGSGFTAAFEALALALCRELPVSQAAALLRCTDKQLWRRIEVYVDQARDLEVQCLVPGLLEPDLALQPFDQIAHRLRRIVCARRVGCVQIRSFEHGQKYLPRARAREEGHSPMDKRANSGVEPGASDHRDGLRLARTEALPRQARDEPVELLARELE